MTTPRTCPKCGRSLADTAEGLCPQCLLSASLEDASTSTDGTGPALTTAARGLLIRYVGDYEIDEPLGAGGMGVVFKAEQRTLRRPVALKLLHAGALASPELVQRFRNEAETAAALSHPNIVGIYEVGEHDGHQYFSMEWVDGPSLATALAEHPMEARAAARLALKLARALEHAHQHGVLHRDIKPSNVLLDKQGEPHLGDFGLAQFRERAIHLTQTGTPMGTPAYMSPEQARGDWKAVSTATDVWGLGAVLYEMLTSRPPFVGQTALETARQVTESEPRPASRLNPAVPVDLETICLKCLQKVPGRRYATASAVAEDLERFLEGRPIQARPVGDLERLWMWVRRKPALAALCALSVLTVLVALSDALSRYRNQVRRLREEEAQVRLQSAQMMVFGTPVRQIGWSVKASNELAAAASFLKRKPYYVNTLANTLEGWEAWLLGPCQAPGTRQVGFDPKADSRTTQLLLAGSDQVQVWNPTDSSATNPVPLHSYPAPAVAYPPGTLIQLLESQAGRLTVWSSLRRQSLGEVALPARLMLPTGTSNVLAAVSEDERRLAVVLEDRTINEVGVPTTNDVVVLWELPTGRLPRTLPVCELAAGQVFSESASSGGADPVPAPKATALALSPDGGLVAIGIGPVNARVLLHDLVANRRLTPFRFSGLAPRCLAIAESRRRSGSVEGTEHAWLIAAGDGSGSIGVYDAGIQRLTALLRSTHTEVNCLAFSPDRMVLASGGRGPVQIWDLAMSQPLLDLDRGDHCDALAFSADARHLAASARAGGTNSSVHLWELANGRGIATLRGPSAMVTRPTFSPRGDRLACVGFDWQVGVWDTERVQLLWLLQGPQGVSPDNCALAFSPDSGLLAISTGREAQLWDLTTGRRLRSWPLPPGLVDVLSYDSTNALYLWRTETVQGDRFPNLSLSWQEHPRVVRLRNLFAAQPDAVLHTITNFNRHIISTAASPDGKYLVVEGTRIVDAEEQRGLVLAESPSARVLLSLPTSSPWRWRQACFDAASEHLAFSLDGTNWLLMPLAATNRWQPLARAPIAVGPHPRLTVHFGSAHRGVEVHDARRGLDFTLQSERQWTAAFDRSGRWLAWETQSGSVVLCDLDELVRHFVAAGLAKPTS